MQNSVGKLLKRIVARKLARDQEDRDLPADQWGWGGVHLIVPHTHTDCSVTEDQSGWGFIVKQGATTISEKTAAYTVSSSCLTMEVEAVTHALRWIASRCDSGTTHAIFLTDSMN